MFHKLLIVVSALALSVSLAAQSGIPLTNPLSEGFQQKAKAMLAQGKFQEAMKAASSLPQELERRDMMMRVLEAVVEENLYGEATKLMHYFQLVEDQFGQAMGYLAIAQAQAKDQMQLAYETYGKAVKAAEKIKDQDLKQQALQTLESQAVQVSFRR